MYMVQIVLEGEEPHWHYPFREIGIRRKVSEKRE